MRRFFGVSLCSLLAALSLGNVAVANHGLPVPRPPLCVGTPACCQTAGPINFIRICKTQYALFGGGDTVNAATVASSLASSMTSVGTAQKTSDAACLLRNSLSQLGADFNGTRFFFQDTAVTVGAKNITVTGGAAVFTAGSAVYVVFGGIYVSSYSPAVTNYIIGGTQVQVSALFLAYYNLYRTAGNDIIQEAVSQYNAAPPTSQVNGRLTQKRLYITGFSAGAVSSLFAALDLLAQGITADNVYVFGQEKPGYANFVTAYMATALGPRTTAWWNALDLLVISPPATNAIRRQIRNGLQSQGDKTLYTTWGVDGKYATLPAANYWRIAPQTNIAGVSAGTCVKVTGSTDVWFTACPSAPINAAKFSCGLNFDDHDDGVYFNKIKQCALADYDKSVIPPPGSFVLTCINNLPLPDGF